MKKKRKSPTYPPMECTRCGAPTPRTSALQKYCRPCSQKADVERKRKHANIKGRARYEANRTRHSERGAALNEAGKLDLRSTAPEMPQMAWYARTEIPFSWAGSKNHIFASTNRGHVYMRDESRYMRSLLTSEVAKAAHGVPLVQNKLWIDIYVQKPRQNGDAVNFVDMVCDAVKDAIPLDDRWYSIRQVDWQIVKVEPKLFVGLGQVSAVNVQACSSCGRLLPFEFFQKNRSLPNGIGRNCRECTARDPNSRRVKDAIETARAELLSASVFG